MFRKHLAPLAETRPGVLATAKLLLGIPYR